MKDCSNIDPYYYESLRQKLISGVITAITFDTQIFDRNGRTFRSGMLAQLAQLKNSNIKLVLSELVRSEAARHMLAMHKTRSIKIDEALTHLQHHLDESLLEEIKEELETRMTPEQIVLNEINDFYLATDAEEISYEEVSTRELFSSYFDNRPPFHKQNLKKSEFPDAVALLSLEKYALYHGILVISDDHDWIKFCNEAQSGNLHCIPDVGTALKLITSVKEEIKEISDKRFVRLKKFSDYGNLELAIKHNIINELKENINIIGRTSFLYRVLCTDVTILSTKHSENNAFGKIRDDSDLTAWILELDAECLIKSTATFTSDENIFIGNSYYESTLNVPSVSIINITNDKISVETMINKETVLTLGAIAPDERRIDTLLIAQ